MLLGNRTVFHKNCCVYRCGSTTAGSYLGTVINNFTITSRNRNIYFQDRSQTISRANAVPNGYTNPYCWVMPQNNGGMASFKFLSGTLSSSIDISGGKNAESSLSAYISVTNADMGLIISMAASLSASLSTTNAELAAVLEMIADGLSATGTLTTPILGAIAGITASLSAAGTLTTGSLADSPGWLSADILPYTELSPENLAAALLNALLADFNEAGSVGEALNNVGASGNPWASALSSNNTSGTFGSHVQKLLKTTTFVGMG